MALSSRYRYDGEEDLGNGVTAHRLTDPDTGETILRPQGDQLAQQFMFRDQPEEPAAPQGSLAFDMTSSADESTPRVDTGQSFSMVQEHGGEEGPVDRPKRNLVPARAPSGQAGGQPQSAPMEQGPPPKGSRAEREMMAREGLTWQSGSAGRPEKWVPSARARAVDPETVQKLQDTNQEAYQSELKRVQMENELKYEDLKDQREQVMLSQLRAQDQIATEKAQMAQKQAAVAEKMADFDAEYEAEADRKIDTGSGGNEFLEAIAVALGAFGASLAGGPNYALQIVNKKTERKIREQERAKKERLGGIDAARNDYQRLLDRGESPAVAKAHIRALESKKLELEAQAMRLSGQYGNKEQELAMVEEGARQQFLAQRAEIEKLEASQVQERFQQGRAASAGGWRRMTDKEFAAQQERELKQDKLSLQIEKARAGSDDETWKQVQAYNDGLKSSGVLEDEQRIDAFKVLKGEMQRMGMEKAGNLESKWIGNREARRVADLVFGQGTSNAWFKDSRDEINARSLFENIKFGIKRKALGAAQSEAEIAGLEKTFEGIQSADQLFAYINSEEKTLDAKKSSVQAGYRPEAVQRREAMKRKLDEEKLPQLKKPKLGD